MTWNTSTYASLEAEAALAMAPQRRWWLGWLQLLCAWVLCMLLCANIALVLAQGLPEGGRPTIKQATQQNTPQTTKQTTKDAIREMTSGKPVGCAATGSSAQPGPVQVERAGPAKGQTLPCGVQGA